MRKFLVIDDSQGRQESYSKVFNFLELDFAFSKKEFLEKIKIKYDGYIVDVIYVEQQYEDYSFQQILQKLPNNKPLFIISEQWSTAMDGMKMAYLRNSEKYTHVLGYLSWNIIHEGDKGENVKDFVKQQISNYYGLAYGAFDQDQDISVLQISDVEFGNPNQENTPDVARSTLRGSVRKALRKLGFTNSDKVDFICVCGDIAYKGEKEEYIKAEKWFRLLGNELLENGNFENMLIVPGNHDYCYNATAGSFYYYDKDKKDFCKRESEEYVEYSEQAMYNFAKFVYNLNGDNSYLLDPYKPVIKRTYEDYGLNFIMLNPIRIGSNKKFNYGLVDANMGYLLDFAEDIAEKDVCNIVLSHLAPDKYSVIDPTSDATNRNIRNIADELKIKGWFYGHAHDDEVIDDRKIGRNKVLLSRTRTLMLNNSQHCEGAGNGWTLFKLSRNKGKIVDISYYDESSKTEISHTKLFE